MNWHWTGHISLQSGCAAGFNKIEPTVSSCSHGAASNPQSILCKEEVLTAADSEEEQDGEYYCI